MYDLHEFVNCNDENFKGSSEEFMSKFVYESLDESAWPVLVYVFAGQPVAWWDEENLCGFVL